jgi:biotin synthase-like enzyme
MNVVTFEYCALYYLNWWLTRDCKYCEAFNGHDETAQREALQELRTGFS